MAILIYPTFRYIEIKCGLGKKKKDEKTDGEVT